MIRFKVWSEEGYIVHYICYIIYYIYIYIYSWSSILWWRLCLASGLLYISWSELFSILLSRGRGVVLISIFITWEFGGRGGLGGLISRHSWSSILWWRLCLASDLLKWLISIKSKWFICRGVGVQCMFYIANSFVLTYHLFSKKF